MKSEKTVLIADDEASMRKNLREVLSDEGLRVLEAVDGVEVVETTRSQHPHLVLLDINLPKADGLTALAQIRQFQPDLPIVVFTAYGTSERAIQAMKAGAYDYVEKPFDLDELLIIIRRALSYGELLGEVQSLRSRVIGRSLEASQNEIIGTSGKLQEIFKTIGKVATTDTTILIQGESGTGKELIADAIQRHSGRRDRPFIKVNCGALPETLLDSEMFGHEKGAFTGAITQRRGRFELAEGGTIFLDEVNNMPPSLQMKLLRILQQKTFERVGGKETLTGDVRVIAATNQDIEREMRQGRFREDLYYRLNVIHIKVPPLRDHPEDIPALAEFFLKKYSPGRSVVISPDAMTKLRYFSWPGNIRELENVVQRAIVLSQGDVITTEHLPLTLRAEGDLVDREILWKEGIPMKQILEDVEKELIIKALHQTNWNQTRAAQLLHIHRRLLFSKMRRYRIQPEKND